MISYRQYAELSGRDIQPPRVMPDLAEGWSAVIASATLELSEAILAAEIGSYDPLVPLLRTEKTKRADGISTNELAVWAAGNTDLTKENGT